MENVKDKYFMTTFESTYYNPKIYLKKEIDVGIVNKS